MVDEPEIAVPAGWHAPEETSDQAILIEKAHTEWLRAAMALDRVTQERSRAQAELNRTYSALSEAKQLEAEAWQRVLDLREGIVPKR